jgi:hypothetical protein
MVFTSAIILINKMPNYLPNSQGCAWQTMRKNRGSTGHEQVPESTRAKCVAGALLKAGFRHDGHQIRPMQL